MRLYLVRHAEAASGNPDELRPLTPAGRDQARELGARLRNDGVRPGAILTSPLLRARETAILVGKELDLQPLADDRLAPGATADKVGEVVSERTRSIDETVIVVGHQPDCSRIAAALTGEPEPSFPPAGSLPIELDP